MAVMVVEKEEIRGKSTHHERLRERVGERYNHKERERKHGLFGASTH